MARLFDDALTEYLEIDSAPITGYPFTVSVWFNSNDITTNQVLIAFLDKDESDEWFSLALRGGDAGDPVALFARETGTLEITPTSTGYSANTWHHACGIGRDSTDRSAFIDGGSEGTGSTDITPTGIDRTSIGRVGDIPSPSAYMSGSIAEIGVWNVALTNAEVGTLAAGYSPLFVRPQSLVFYLPLIKDADNDLVGGLGLTAFNTPSTSAHTRVLYPIRPADLPPVDRTVTGTASINPTSSVSAKGQMKNVLGIASHTAALSFTPSPKAWYDGKYHYGIFDPSDGSSAESPVIAFADRDDMFFGGPVAIPFVGTTRRGYNVTMFYGSRQTYGAYSATVMNTDYKAVVAYKDNDSLSNSKSMGGNREGSITDITQFPSIIYDNKDSAWIAGSTGIAGEVRVRKAADPYQVDDWDAYTVLSVIGAGDEGLPQLLPFETTDDDIGALYCEAGSAAGAGILHFKYYNGTTPAWGSEETVDSNTKRFASYRGVPPRNNKVFVVYRDATDNKLYYRIRSAGSGGSWGTDTLINDDTELDNTSRFTSCANVGEDESVYIIYEDTSGDIVYRVWNGTSISGKTTLVSSPSLLGNYFSAPLFESREIGVLYYTTDGNIRLATISITPTQVSTDGTFIASDGSCNQSTDSLNIQMVSRGNKNFVIYTGRDHQAWGNVWDSSTASFDFSWTMMGEKRYWDLHNTMTCFIGENGFVYVAEGGRNASNTTENIIIDRSGFALDDVSFSLTGWTDISPSGLTGRGYKGLLVDNNNIPHLIFMIDGQDMTIREYRSGSWSAPTTIVALNDNGNLLYWIDTQLGNESPGQKSINLVCNYRDLDVQPEIYTGSLMGNELFYLKLLPQGDGTYKGYNAAEVEFTLPCSESNKDLIISGEDVGGTNSITVWAAETVTAIGDQVFDVAKSQIFVCTARAGDFKTGASEPTWDTDHNTTTDDDTNVTWTEVGLREDKWPRTRGGVEIISTTTPCTFDSFRETSDPFAMVEYSFWKWDGTNWVKVVVQNSDFPYDSIPKMVVGSEGLFIVTNKDFSGVSELIKYVSEDNGDTFDSGTRLTTSSFNNRIPLLSTRTGIIQNLIWGQRIHRNYNEVLFTTLQIGTGGSGYMLPLMGVG